MLIDIFVDTVIELALYLKTAQLNTMSNSDDFVTILPPCKVYKMRLTHGCDSSKTSTKVIGVKGTPKDAKLLGKFFMQLAAKTSNDHCDGTFLPKGAVHLLGQPMYVLKDNNFFLMQVAMIPVNLEYKAWFAVIDPDTSDNNLISLNDHLLCKTWFLQIKLVGRNKCILVTTHTNLLEAHNWIDANLEKLIQKSIPPGINPPAALLP